MPNFVFGSLMYMFLVVSLQSLIEAAQNSSIIKRILNFIHFYKVSPRRHLRCGMGLLYRLKTPQMRNGAVIQVEDTSDAEWGCYTG